VSGGDAGISARLENRAVSRPLEGVCPNGHVRKDLYLVGWGEPFVCPVCGRPLTLREAEPRSAALARPQGPPKAPKRHRRRKKAKGPLHALCPYGHRVDEPTLWGCRHCLLEAILGLSPRVKRKEYRDMTGRGIPLRKGPSATGWQDPVYPAYKCRASVTLAKIAPRWLREEIYQWLSTKTPETARIYRRVITDFIKKCTWLFSETTYAEMVVWAERRGGNAMARRDLSIVSSFTKHLQQQDFTVENHALEAKRVFKA